jgi:hypothetical protein
VDTESMIRLHRQWQQQLQSQVCKYAWALGRSVMPRTGRADHFRQLQLWLMLQQDVTSGLIAQPPAQHLNLKVVTMYRCCFCVCRASGYVCICMHNTGRHSAVQQTRTYTAAAAAAAAVWRHADTSSALAIADHLAAVYVGGLCHVLVCT